MFLLSLINLHSKHTIEINETNITICLITQPVRILPYGKLPKILDVSFCYYSF